MSADGDKEGWTRRATLGGIAAAVGAGNVERTTAEPSRRVMPGFAALQALASTPLPQPVIRVADHGARGDGRSNDTRAIAAASRALQAAGGGTLLFEPRTYIIGVQGGPSAEWARTPEPVVFIRGCRRPVAVIGNGAVLRSAPGLRFGTFDRTTGRPRQVSMPFTEQGTQASPYAGAIALLENRGGVEVRGFELDGRIADAIIGGQWGDTGWQVNHCGLWLYNNKGPHLVRDIQSHDHGQDGMLLFTEVRSDSEPTVPMRVENFVAENNGRQGISLTGGKGVELVNCRLNRTGRNGAIASNPGAGLDVEAEFSIIRDVRAVNCEFLDNVGNGFVADSGDSARIRFEGCRFVGTSTYAAWPNKPGISFERCSFSGSVVRCFDDPGLTGRATEFIDCRFDDLPLAPSAPIPGGYVDLGGSGAGTLFERCSFDYRNQMRLPYTSVPVRYRDCMMRQRETATSYPRGIYSGTNRIHAPDGAVGLEGSRFNGPVYLNEELIGGR